MNQQFETLVEKLMPIEVMLKEAAEEKLIAIQSYDYFQRKLKRAQKNADNILNLDRTLKIGIVGQVKAGKSSFLNALIFDGKNMLPKAATPMTAALTKIVYGEQTQAKVYFYSQQDWEDGIEKLDRRYEEIFNTYYQKKYTNEEKKEEGHSKKSGLSEKLENGLNKVKDTVNRNIPFFKQQARKYMEQKYPDYTAAHDLVQMSRKSDIEIAKLPSSKVVPFHLAQEDLLEYVGAGGRYTPFVKYLELTFNLPLLKGIEIIDTPGLGDPILSRSQKTKDFLMACDIVFLLSVSSQFLSREDLILLEKTLPAEAISHAVLVGTKFDQALLENSSRNKIPLKDVVNKTRRNISANVTKRIEIACQKQPQNKVLAQVYDSLPPQFTSSLCYLAAQSLEENKALDEEVEHILRQMELRFNGVERKSMLLYALSNIKKMRTEEFEAVHEKKQKIIAERSQQFTIEQSKAFLMELDDIEIKTEQMLKSLRADDIESLQQKLTISREVLTALHKRLRDVFLQCGLDIRRYIIDIKNAVNHLSSQYRNLTVQTELRVIHRKETHWFRKTEHWDDTEDIKFATVSEAINHVNDYISRADELVSEQLKNAVDIIKIRNQVKDIVYKAFKNSEANFDENDIVGPVENALKEITLPPFNLVNRDKFEKIISDSFQDAAVEGNKVHELAKVQSEVIAQVGSAFSQGLEDHADVARKTLEEESIVFYDEVKGQIEDRIKRLQSLVQNKQENIEKLECFLAQLAQAKQVLREGEEVHGRK